jgi:VWFA-related protein
MRTAGALGLCAAASAAALTARQGAPPPQPRFRGGVDVVQVDVSVLDKDRRPVRGLTARDFTVREDGKTRPIVAFVPVELGDIPAPTGRAAWVREVAPDVVTNAARPEGRLVVIMFDWSIRFEDQQLARRIATAAVDQLGPDDLAAVVFTSAFANNGTPQNFTADRARLLSAINRPFAMALHNPSVGPTHDPRNTNDVMIDDPEGYESGDCLCRVCVPEAIARVADAVRDVQGRRKTLLFIGTYFRSYESLQGPVSRPAPGPPASITGIVRPSVNTMACSARLEDARDKMTRAMGLANLTIHTLDPVGFETSLNSPRGGSVQAIEERQYDLKVLADLGGGRTVMNTEAPEAQIPAIFAESHAYYLVAFTPADTDSKGRFHKIEVQVDRPGVTVRTRSGYYAGETRASGRTASAVAPETADALGGVLPRSDVPLAVTAEPFALPGGKESAVMIVLGVQQQMPDAQARRDPVKVLAAAFDRNGRAVQSESQTIGLTWHPDATGSMPYELVSRLVLRPGRYEVRVALDAAADEHASVYTYVDVPDFSGQPLSLSGIVLSASTPMVSASTKSATGILPIVPTARRQFAPADRVTAFLRVYEAANKAPQPATVTAKIVDTQDRVRWQQVLALTADSFGAAHSADCRLDVPVSVLDAGQYLLVVDATRGDLSARRGVRFAVR